MAEIQCFQASDSDFPGEMAEGEQDVKARSAAKGYQGPDVQNCSASTSRRPSFRAPRRQVIPPGALKTWAIWGLDIQNASLRADGCQRDVFLSAPAQ